MRKAVRVRAGRCVGADREIRQSGLEMHRGIVVPLCARERSCTCPRPCRLPIGGLSPSRALLVYTRDCVVVIRIVVFVWEEECRLLAAPRPVIFAKARLAEKEMSQRRCASLLYPQNQYRGPDFGQVRSIGRRRVERKIMWLRSSVPSTAATNSRASANFCPPPHRSCGRWQKR